MSNAWAWKDKENRKERAIRLTKIIEEKYSDLVKYSVANSYIYSPNSVLPINHIGDKDTQIIVDNIDSVQAIMKYGTSNTAVLNFASYKEPGGMFLQGSMAQEEALCHESILYNVLRELPQYYDWNKKNLNKGLYLDRAIYSKNVDFRHIDKNGHIQEKMTNVITCAAPNKSTAQKYQNVSDDLCNHVMENRIRFILQIAAENNQDTLVLGAFGCGVFGNNAKDVAEIFKKLLDNEFKGCFSQVVFAVPGNISDYNFQAFKKTFRLSLKEEVKKIKEIEMEHPIEFFINDALQVCGYAEQDGFVLNDIIAELKNFNGNTEKLHAVYGKYYDENNRIYEQYIPIAGYMQCIGHDIHVIDEKIQTK